MPPGPLISPNPLCTGDTFHPILLQAFGRAWWTSRDAAIVAVASCCILPLTFRSSLGALRGKPCCWGHVCRRQVAAWLERAGWTARAAVECMLRPLCAAAVSSLAVSAILLVVGAVVYGSVRIVNSPGYSWAGVRAFNPSAEFFGALPLIVLSFSVRCGGFWMRKSVGSSALCV